MPKVDWDFIDGADTPQPGINTPNLPTPEGAELGREVARMADAQYTQTGRDTRCHDCAFRLGTIPNQSAASLMDAVKCVMEGVPFNCHIDQRPCWGWVASQVAKAEVA